MTSADGKTESRGRDTVPYSISSDEFLTGGAQTDEINLAYNLFSAESMKHYRGVVVRLDRNFRGHMASKPSEWEGFRSVVELCRNHGFNLRCYVKYCFLNRLAPHGRGKALRDIAYLTRFPQISDYERNRERIERLYGIYMSIMRSVMKIRGICRTTGRDAKAVIKSMLSSGNLGLYVETASVSRFFLSILPNAATVIHELAAKNPCEEAHVIEDLCCTVGKIAPLSREALAMFWPTAGGRSVVELCSPEPPRKKSQWPVDTAV